MPCTLCSSRWGEYPTLERVANDFAEFPSQFNEHCATYPSIFKNYAKHYKTGEAMPAVGGKNRPNKNFNTGLRPDARRGGFRTGYALAFATGQCPVAESRHLREGSARGRS